MSQASVVGGWLSPTRAWRLIECPASVRPAGTASILSAGVDCKVNTGTLAHRALELWIRTGGYSAQDPRATLAKAADACAVQLPGGPPSSWRIARARLVARGPSLCDLIGSRTPDEVLSEVELQDADLQLRGQLDLLLLGDEIVVVDLKTQTLVYDQLPDWVTFQLTVYAHLIEKSYGVLPARAEVFSLNRGRIPVPITTGAVGRALTALAAAQNVDPSQANPSPDACLFCRRRLECQPHWDSAPGWAKTDAVEGIIQRAERAATGVVALLLEATAGLVWVSGIPADPLNAAVGEAVRVVRVRPRELKREGVSEWQWRRQSALAVGFAG